jgi:hypothetical protein
MDKWEQIKTEYVTTDIGLRPLAKKHDVSFTTIAKRAARERWTTLRQQQDNSVTTALLETHKEIKVEEYKSLLRAAGVLSDKLCQVVENVEATELTVDNMRDLRSLTMAIKDLAEVQGLKSDADRREQEARIKNLERQSEVIEQEPVKVVIAGAEGFCQK